MSFGNNSSSPSALRSCFLSFSWLSPYFSFSFTLSPLRLQCWKAPFLVPPCFPARPSASLPSASSTPPYLSICLSVSLPVYTFIYIYVYISLHDTNLTASLDSWSLAIPITISRYPWVCLNLEIVMVQSVCGESGQIVQHAFRGKLSKLWQWAESNEVLFSGKSLKLLIVVKNHFQRYIICLCLISFAWSCVFREQQWKMSI